MAKVTQRDIADALGVSTVTVSNALSGKKGVSETLRTEIIKKAEEMGMHPGKYGARVMDHYTIGIYVSGWYISVGTSFYWEMYQKTAYAASRRHCFTMLEISDKFHEEPLPKLLQEGGEIDGLIIIGKIREDSLKSIVETAEVPIVLMDFNDPYFACDAVLSENYFGMYRAAECLASAGHREIGFLGDFGAYRNGTERFFGYRKCLMERGLSYDPAFTLTEKKTLSGETFVVLPKRLPTAFACSSDYLATLLVQALEKRGLRIPEDISIASYDHYLTTKLSFGELTTYEVDMNKMAKTAVKRLIRRMRGDTGRPVTKYVEGKIVHGDSIRHVNGAARH
jgi:DNA-binding LacI/PurR family transcriptional regulator